QPTTLTYDPGGRRTSLVQGNGIVTAFTYDAANRLTSLSPSGGEGQGEGASSLPSFAYGYDRNGNPQSKTFADGTQETYFYDGLDRLTKVAFQNGSVASYTLDPTGNREIYELTTQAGSVQAQDSTANAFNELTSIRGNPPLPSMTYTYDPNGNRTSGVLQPPGFPLPPSQTTTYTWTLDDRLATATLPNGQLDTFKYDANGLRVGKSDSTGSVRYLIDPLTQAILATYDAGTGLRLMQFNQNPQRLGEVFSVKNAQGTKLYPMTDMLGSVYALADATGTPQATYSYDVYGAQTVVSGSLGYPFAFTGCELDRDLGTNNCGQRVYDPQTGSWFQPDRTQVVTMTDGVNLYEYVQDRPTIARDPMGTDIDLFTGSNDSDPTMVALFYSAIATRLGMELYISLNAAPVTVKLKDWSQAPPSSGSALVGGESWSIGAPPPGVCSGGTVGVSVNYNQLGFTPPGSGARLDAEAVLVHEFQHVWDFVNRVIPALSEPASDEDRAFAAAAFAEQDLVGDLSSAGFILTEPYSNAPVFSFVPSESVSGVPLDHIVTPDDLNTTYGWMVNPQ
ncbi:MAG: RHS repeat domain-containing protein, partial [Acidiferrobacteraceae bacterium]